MKRILKLILKSNPIEVQTNQRGLSTNPISKAKKNAFAVLFGLALGLYIGQYFPDIYFENIQQNLP
jgi:hypothetical protein